ncbi:CpaF family protein [Sinisalibacter aestuarii]|uniref:CpaF pilus assembly protein, ATPase CpaF n=1 Tax=Sinisalibacter aestuarii TaxID=2949426 RepID=A0ABQ5LUG1_9RHOB|nr:CpaF family protein [Sinisalibacter aestuarii]GKY88617.1 CpaF pilus assembly protein, ATPase CpaF [Sinisalibacter aestuarii]
MFKSFSKSKPAPSDNVVVFQSVSGAAASDKPQAEPQPPFELRTPEDPKLSHWLELKSKLHEALLDRLNLSVIDKVERSELTREVAGVVGQVLKSTGEALQGDEFNRLVEELINEILGFGPLEPLLADPSVNDILVNGHRDVFVERHGVLERAQVRFRDEKHLLRIIDKIVSRVGRRIDESQPWVDARLEDGSRVNAIIRPCAIDGPSVSIRKFAASPLTMDKLIEIGTVSGPAASFLRALVEARMNILISGGTGSGKTTMLNALSSYIGERERIVTIEDAAELQLQQAHVVRLETRPPSPLGTGAVVQRDLVRNALRMRPDRIIVGEVRGAESFDMLQAMNTGHDGSMTTVHANTARDALSRLEQMVTMTGVDFPISAVRAQIASGLHLVVQLARLSDGRRRVMSISEITGMEGDVIALQDIFVFQKQGRAETGEVQGRFRATGIRPKCAEQLIAAGVEFDPAAFRSGEA